MPDQEKRGQFLGDVRFLKGITKQKAPCRFPDDVNTIAFFYVIKNKFISFI